MARKTTNPRGIKSLAFALTLLASVASNNAFAEQVYKWTDDSGTIHYSDKKPNDIDAKRLKVQGGKKTGDRASAQNQAGDLAERNEKQLAKKAEALQQSTAKREKDSRCQTIRDNLKKIEENSRIRIEENGELRYLTPEEIEEKTSKYKTMLEENCI